ncbi:hypothetical protein [Streptomyces sp. NPDC048644]|uniref:hypothetical protein n=1 Tax=Streptomyces sp. NPDC048644 TaxID=3365582 RepID=UPI0037203762
MKTTKHLAAFGAALATTLIAGPAYAISTGPATSHAVHAATGYTVACNSPGDTANFHYKEGTVHTTVYFNNHCTHAVNVKVSAADAHRCLTTEAGEKGNRLYLMKGNVELHRDC